MNILDLSNMGASKSTLADLDVSGQLTLHDIAENLKPFGEVGVTYQEFSRGSMDDQELTKYEEIYVYSGRGCWHLFSF